MPIEVVCPGCGRRGKAPDEAAGRRGKCPKCGAGFLVPETAFDLIDEEDDLEEDDLEDDDEGGAGRADLDAPADGERVAPDAAFEPASPAARDRPWQYKVLTQKDKWFSGKFDPMALEQALNAYAQQGWRLRGVATASIPGFGGPRDEMIFVLER